MLRRRLAPLLLVFVLLLTACGGKAPAWQEQYDLGVKYLTEGNYEEAIIAFTAAIEIEPKEHAFYVALAQAYYGQGDTEKADEAMAKAQELLVQPAVARTERQDHPEQNNYGVLKYDADGRLIWFALYDLSTDELLQAHTCFYDSQGRMIREITESDWLIDVFDVFYSGATATVALTHQDEDRPVLRAAFAYSMADPDNTVREAGWHIENDSLASITLLEEDPQHHTVFEGKFRPDGAPYTE